MPIVGRKKLQYNADFLKVEYQSASGSPVTWSSTWRPLWDADVERLDLSPGKSFSVATITFPLLRWNDACPLAKGDHVRVVPVTPPGQTAPVLFDGYVVVLDRASIGGTITANQQVGSKCKESLGVTCLDNRWRYHVGTALYGQLVRGVSGYNPGTAGPDLASPIATDYLHATGRRCVFNANGRPDRDPTGLVTGTGSSLIYYPLFNPRDAVAEFWTARDMIAYALNPFWFDNQTLWSTTDPYALYKISHTDFDTVLHDITAEGLSAIETIELVCKHIGWSFKEMVTAAGAPDLAFYKVGQSDQGSNIWPLTRSSNLPAIAHELHAPAPGESVADAAAAGKKLLWSFETSDDITSVINTPIALGGVHRFEFTAELVPGWLDADLLPDTSDSNANLFFSEADLEYIDSPDSYSFFNKYHTRGAAFAANRSVGRKWVLNEDGHYSDAAHGDRGGVFAFETVLDAANIIDPITGTLLYGPFQRSFLEPLSQDARAAGSVGIAVEFSFDSGVTWQKLPCAIANCVGECGIVLAADNLAEIAPKEPGTISGGTLDGVTQNYWTSLADDKVNSRSFKAGAWHTRVRVTASVQMDRRLMRQSPPTTTSGSPFVQKAVFDMANRYKFQQRQASSVLTGTAANQDDTVALRTHLALLQKTNEFASVRTQFTFDRFHLGDRDGVLDFMPGDVIQGLTGRTWDFRASLIDPTYPDIVRITYHNKPRPYMQVFCRDLKFAGRP